MASPVKKSLVLQLTKAKETSGTWMFLADDDTSPVKNVYFSKVGLDKIDNAEKIKVTIEPV